MIVLIWEQSDVLRLFTIGFIFIKNQEDINSYGGFIWPHLVSGFLFIIHMLYI